MISQTFRIPFRRAAALGILAAAGAMAQTAAPVRWAFIGNSITQGPGDQAYPVETGKLLGPGYQIQNDGVSGRTLLKAGDYPIWKEAKFADVFKFKPDIISIKLGTNDSKPINWDTHKGEFERDLLAMIDTLGTISSKPRIWLIIPVPAFSDGAGSGGIRGSVIKNEIIPIIKKVAADRGLPTIDLYTPMLTHQAFFPDNVHPNNEGHDSIAAIIYRTYLAKSTRIACIGNSITEYAQGDEAKNAYTIKLGELFGASHYAVNKGRSGAYMQKVSPSPYWNTGLLKQVMDFKPNVVTIKLGTNDSRADYWHSDKFIADYKAMIDTLNTLNPKPKIWMCTPVPAWQRNGVWPFNGISNDIIKSQTIPAITQIAKDKGLEIIDLYNPMLSQEALVPDGVHPNAAGQDTIARLIYRAMNKPTVAVRPIADAVMAWPEIALRHGSLSIAWPDAREGTARLFTLDGKEVASLALRGGTPALMTLSGLPSGRYLVAVEANGIAARVVKPISF